MRNMGAALEASVSGGAAGSFASGRRILPLRVWVNTNKPDPARKHEAAPPTAKGFAHPSAKGRAKRKENAECASEKPKADKDRFK